MSDTKVQCWTCGKYHKSPKGLKSRKVWNSLILYFCPACPVKTPEKPKRPCNDGSWELK